MAPKAGVWIETGTEGGQRFMTAWGKQEQDAASDRPEKRDTNGIRKVVILQVSVESPERYRLALLTSRRNPVRARDGSTFVAPRHVGGSRGASAMTLFFWPSLFYARCCVSFCFFLRVPAAALKDCRLEMFFFWGGGAGGVGGSALPDFLFLFSFPCLADRKRD